MIQLSEEMESVLRAQASSSGLTPEEILREALARIGDPLPWRDPARLRPAAVLREQLIAGMEEIAARSAARPPADLRSPDEIIGYDDFGLPR